MEHQYNTDQNTIYIGNLDRQVTEQIIMDIFRNGLQQINDKVLSCKLVVPTDATDPYSFVTFADRGSAMAAITFMDGRDIFKKKVRANWASSAGQGGRKEPRVMGQHYSIFVGDLDNDITDDDLRKAFQVCGDVMSTKVIRDMQTGTSKGFGFVSFRSQLDAQHAISSMQGKLLGTKTIRTNWATRNQGNNSMGGGGGGQKQPVQQLNYNDVYRAATQANTTVYVSSLPYGVSDETLRDVFEPYGNIADTRVFHEKGYAFIKYMNHESAATAIVKCNGEDIDGSLVKCWWGKENDQVPQSAVQGQTQTTSVAAAAQPQATAAAANTAAYSMYQYHPYAAYYQAYWAALQQQQQQQMAGASSTQSQAGQQPTAATASQYAMMQPQQMQAYQNAMYSQMYQQQPGYAMPPSASANYTQQGGSTSTPQGYSYQNTQ